MVCPLVQILWVRWPFSYLVCSDTNTFIYFCILYLLMRAQGTAKGFLDGGRPDKVWGQSTEGRRDKSAASCQQLNDNHSNWTSFAKVAWSHTHRSSTTPYHSKKLILASCVVTRKKLGEKYSSSQWSWNYLTSTRNHQKSQNSKGSVILACNKSNCYKLQVMTDLFEIWWLLISINWIH